MNLELAVAETCGPTSCTVRYVDTSASVQARYSARVQNRVKVRPGDLVAVDRGVAPPEIVWRWWHGTVERVEGGRAFVSRNITQQAPGDPRRATVAVGLSEGLAGGVAPGDTVFFEGQDEKLAVAVARGGVPADPARLRVARFPQIVSAYEGSTGA